MSGARDLIEAVRRWRDETGDTSALRAARIVLGLLLLDAAIRAERELQSGYFGDVFHWPILPEALVAPRALYAVLVGAQVLLAIVVLVGAHARAALLSSALLATYVLLCDRLQFHHNRWALICFAALLSLSPCDRSFRIGTSIGPSEGPLWAARLAQLQVSLIYVASAGSKLLDADWRGGRVLLERFRLYGEQAIDAGVPQRVVGWLSRADVASGLAKLAIATELLLAVGLWARRARFVALGCGIGFHLVIEVAARVEGFSWLMLSCYGLFFMPEIRALRARVARS
jgi:hypothetical protein